MFVGVNVALNSVEPSKLTGLGVSKKSSHDEIVSFGTLTQVKRQLIDRVINDSAIRARSIAYFQSGNVCPSGSDK